MKFRMPHYNSAQYSLGLRSDLHLTSAFWHDMSKILSPIFKNPTGW